jgi:hypothetical protein
VRFFAAHLGDGIHLESHEIHLESAASLPELGLQRVRDSFWSTVPAKRGGDPNGRQTTLRQRVESNGPGADASPVVTPVTSHCLNRRPG